MLMQAQLDSLGVALIILYHVCPSAYLFEEDRFLIISSHRISLDNVKQQGTLHERLLNDWGSEETNGWCSVTEV